MGDLRINCPKCGKNLVFPAEPAGRSEWCPFCGVALKVGPSGSTSRPVPVASSPNAFPKRMKANRALMGRICVSCKRAIELGQDVFNCPSCQQTMHHPCSEKNGGCMNPDCQESAELKLEEGAPAAAVSSPLSPSHTVECKFCREAILPGAVKCRYCGELQGAAARAAERRRKIEVETDDQLTISEIVFGVLCAGIALIVGLIWGIQGKKKGWKLMAIAACMATFWTIIRVLLGKR